MAATNPPKPPEERRRRNAPARGEWQEAVAVGWQHGAPPKPPSGLLKVSREVWELWLGAWFAAHWQPEDLPGLYLVIRLYDAVQRGELQRSAELRQQMDTYGMTPKGQQDRRWRRPTADEAGKGEPRGPAARGRYGHLRPVPEKRAARPRKVAGS